MTKEELFFLYKKAYKEAAEYSVKVAQRQFGPPTPAKTVNDLSGINVNPIQGRDYQMVMDTGEPEQVDNYSTPVPVPGVSYRQSGPPAPAYSYSEAYQYSPVDYYRQALAQVYGNNHLNDLSDDGYVMRKWRAAMQGRRRADLMAAYRQAYLGHNGMTAQQGRSYGGSNAKGYGIADPYYRQSRQMAGNGPRFQDNAYGQAARGQYDAIQYWRNFQKQRSVAFRNQANQQARKMNGVPPVKQQAAQPLKPQSTTTSAVPDDLRKEVIGSLGNNSMTA